MFKTNSINIINKSDFKFDEQQLLKSNFKISIKFLTDFDATNTAFGYLSDDIVMIARYVHDTGTFPGHFQQAGNNLTVSLRPGLARRLQTPEIDDVADKVEMIAGVSLKEIEQQTHARIRRAEVNVR